MILRYLIASVFLFYASEVLAGTKTTYANCSIDGPLRIGSGTVLGSGDSTFELLRTDAYSPILLIKIGERKSGLSEEESRYGAKILKIRHDLRLPDSGEKGSSVKMVRSQYRPICSSDDSIDDGKYKNEQFTRDDYHLYHKFGNLFNRRNKELAQQHSDIREKKTFLGNCVRTNSPGIRFFSQLVENPVATAPHEFGARLLNIYERNKKNKNKSLVVNLPYDRVSAANKECIIVDLSVHSAVRSKNIRSISVFDNDVYFEKRRNIKRRHFHWNAIDQQ